MLWIRSRSVRCQAPGLQQQIGGEQFPAVPLDDRQDPQRQGRDVRLFADGFFLLPAIGQHPHPGPGNGPGPQRHYVVGADDRSGLLGDLLPEPLAIGRREPIFLVQAEDDSFFHLAQFGEDHVLEVFERAVDDKQHQIRVAG